MTRGRRPDWEHAVADLAGSAVAKARLTALLASLSGRRTVAEVALELGLSERRLHQLRLQMLQAALNGLEPLSAGRPAQRAAAVDPHTDALQAQLRQLRLELHAAQVREEIALVMPQLLERGGRQKKTRRRQTRAGNRARPCGERDAARR
jgi:hypothetical protein